MATDELVEAASHLRWAYRCIEFGEDGPADAASLLEAGDEGWEAVCLTQYGLLLKRPFLAGEVTRPEEPRLDLRDGLPGVDWSDTRYRQLRPAAQAAVPFARLLADRLLGRRSAEV